MADRESIHEEKFYSDHEGTQIRERLSSKKSPDFSSSTLRRVAFMEQGRKR